MAVANLAEMQAAVATARQQAMLHHWDIADASDELESALNNFIRDPGSYHQTTLTAPTTAAALSYSTDPDWALPRPLGSSGLHIVDAITSMTDTTSCVYWIVDRLSHQGGLDANIITSQTTNLPTAALPTRATGGAGVWCAIEGYANTGATDTTITVTYTNQSGTGSRTGTATTSNGWDINWVNLVQLEGTDTGVRSVESVQLDVATGSSGDIGITLFKPIAMVCPGLGNMRDTWDRIIGWQESIDDEACLNAWLDISDGRVAAERSITLGYADF